MIPVVLFLASWCAWGQGTDRRAEDLLKDCAINDTNHPSAEAIGCLAYVGGFVAGIAHVQLIYTVAGDKPPMVPVKVICLPSEGISGDQARKIVVKYLEEHPEELHKPAQDEIFVALWKAFPSCKVPPE